MKEVQLGQRVKAVAIQRVNVADNVKGRAMLLDINPRVKQIAYDERVRRTVEVSQEDCIRHRLSPRPTYYLLVGRLNTDMNGTVVGSDIMVEYLQLSSSIYEKFADSVVEAGGPSRLASILLTKIVNKEYGYVNPVPSAAKDFPKEALEKIQALRSNKELINSMWGMVDVSTSITIDQYEEMLEEKGLYKRNPVQEYQSLPSANIQSDNSIDTGFATTNGFEEEVEFTEAEEVEKPQAPKPQG